MLANCFHSLGPNHTRTTRKGLAWAGQHAPTVPVATSKQSKQGGTAAGFPGSSCSGRLQELLRHPYSAMQSQFARVVKGADLRSTACKCKCADSACLQAGLLGQITQELQGRAWHGLGNTLLQFQWQPPSSPSKAGPPLASLALLALADCKSPVLQCRVARVWGWT